MIKQPAIWKAQGMLLAEKYAELDLNSFRNQDRREGKVEGLAEGKAMLRYYIASTHPEYTDEQIEAIIAEFSATSNPAV